MASYQKSADAVSETIDDESIVINLDTGMYFSFRGWSAWAWEALISGMPVSDVDAPVAAVGGASGFVAALLEHGLITIRGDIPVAIAPEQPDSGPDPLVVERFDDMADMILLDPVHEVDRNEGWPRPAPKA